eukprot:739883-Rhodomonas_salina.1
MHPQTTPRAERAETCSITPKPCSFAGCLAGQVRRRALGASSKSRAARLSEVAAATCLRAR